MTITSVGPKSIQLKTSSSIYHGSPRVVA